MLRCVLAMIGVTALLAGCSSSHAGTGHASGSGSAPSSPSASSSGSSAAVASGLPSGWTDQDVTFRADGMTIYATYRHPASTVRAPAALLIAGSGNPDRNGDEPNFPENSLRLIADQLAHDGVATLRYDKLGSGRTGLGRYAADPASIGVAPFRLEAAAALRYLAGRPRTDPAHLQIFGHSEGALYALLATAEGGPSAPRVSALGLIEPLSRRTLDVAQEQLDDVLDAATQQGKATAAAAALGKQRIAAAVAAVRAGHSPGQVPAFARAIFNPTSQTYLTDVDRFDPATVAARLTTGTKVLVTCSSNDTQVFCSDVEHLVAGLHQGGASVDFARLAGFDHGLKADTTPTSTKDTANEPMAPALAAAIDSFERG